MIIQTMSGKLVNADHIAKYMWTEVDGTPCIGGGGNWFLTGFFDDGEHIILGCFHSSTDGTREDECSIAWDNITEAIRDNIPHYIMK